MHPHRRHRALGAGQDRDSPRCTGQRGRGAASRRRRTEAHPDAHLRDPEGSELIVVHRHQHRARHPPVRKELDDGVRKSHSPAHPRHNFVGAPLRNRRRHRISSPGDPRLRARPTRGRVAHEQLGRFCLLLCNAVVAHDTLVYACLCFSLLDLVVCSLVFEVVPLVVKAKRVPAVTKIHMLALTWRDTDGDRYATGHFIYYDSSPIIAQCVALHHTPRP